jgi:GTPase SAR1 family protein
MNYYSVCFGEVGSGKSSLIKAFLRYAKKDDSKCIAAPSVEGVTKAITPYEIQRNDGSSDRFYLIDTPGLNEASKDKQNIEIMRNQLSGNSEEVSRIRCILFVMKVTDYRFTNSMIEMIKELINVFPSYNFWEHVIVIRTHTIEKDQIDLVKGNFLKSVLKDKTISQISNEKGIKKPNSIKEFYVNTVVHKQVNTNMDNEINNILNAIAGTDPLYGEVIYSEKKEKKVGRTTIIYQTMSFKDYNSTVWHDVDKILETKGSKSPVTKPVGSPYSKSCTKGKFQKYQDYLEVYDEKGVYVISEPYGVPYERRV